jgi:hypothetical protein
MVLTRIIVSWARPGVAPGPTMIIQETQKRSSNGRLSLAVAGSFSN